MVAHSCHSSTWEAKARQEAGLGHRITKKEAELQLS